MNNKLIYRIVLFAFLLSVSFISCNRDEDDKLTEMQEVVFSIEGNETKSTQTGSFDEDDRIGVFAVEHTGSGLGSTPNIFHSNLEYRFDGTEFRPASGVKPIRFNGKPMDFYVYAPYSAGNNDIRSIKFSAVNQDTESGWKQSDFVTAVNTTGIKEGEVPLHFYHKFATVRLNVQEIPGITGVYMKSVKPGAVLNFATNKAAVTSSTSDLKMLYQGSNNGRRTYDLTIPIQSIGTGQELFVLKKSSDADVKCMVQAGKTLSEGNVTLFGIDLIMDVSFGSFPVFQGTVTGNGKYDFNSNCTIIATPNKGYHFTGWLENGVKFADNASHTFPVLTNRVFTPTFLTDTTYGEWTVSVSANPTSIVSGGGSSAITGKAVRDILVNGVKANVENATPVFSHNNPLFTFSGNSLSIGNNTTTSQRSCIVTATYAGKSSTCAVTQAAGTQTYGVWSVSVSASPTTIASAGGSSSISSSAIRDVFVNGVKTGTQPGTPTLSRDNGVFTLSGSSLSVGNNTTTSQRSCVVTATIEGKSATCSVVQAAGTQSYGVWNVSVSATPTSIASAGGSSTISSSAVRDILVNGVKTGTQPGTPTLSRDNGVFTLSGSSLSVGNNTTTSQRNCVVTASIDGKSATCSVVQAAGSQTYGTWTVSVSASPTTIASAGGSSSISSSAVRDVFVNGVKTGTQPGTPTLSRDNGVFTLSGNSLSVGNNTTTSQRSCVVTATIEGKSATCSVVQAAGTQSYGVWNVSVSATPTSIVSAGGSSTISFSAVRDILVNGVKTGTQPGTPTLSRDNGVFTLSGSSLSVGNNTTTSQRNCVVTASIDGKSATCSVVQVAGSQTYGAWSVSVSASPTSIGLGGGNSTISSSAVRDVFVNGVKTGTQPGTPALSRDNSAFTLSGNTLSVGNNPISSPRTCIVTANMDGKTATCSVTQAAGVVVTYQYTFSTSNYQVSSGANAGSHTASITSFKTRYENGVPTGTRENVSYSLWRCESWISANNSPAFSWSANTSTSSRTGYVYWQQAESGNTDYAIVTQAGAHVPVITTETSYEISISPTSYTFVSAGGSKAFTVTCTKVVKTFTDGSLTNTDRTAYSGYSTSVSGTGFSGSGNTVNAAKNNSTSARSGRFTVSAGGYSSYATLNQEGAFDIGTEI